ncbi:tRNA-binding protein [Enterococcus florum]|uniref:tRNA-binding protein n=1 Tax=Enterococcus florum TaxID=2480627 RepID=A0A4P5P9R9_9ENTE|nr:phenylalanine--tRNA ligase beta subunit-related protein [Enterococcus florum]GCF92971.1 tRNA-binding protein [Enterococcus florum]
MKVVIEDHLKKLGVTLAYTVVEFENETYSEKIWQELLNPLLQTIEEKDSIERIKDDEAMIATKKVYRALGKDPARFRPSSDSLWRRVIQKKGLYQINSLVDLNNYFSLKYKLPFGSYDAAKIAGEIRLGVGQEGESYSGIGKKAVNIENLMVLIDAAGAFGSPTSDSTRAMISDHTSQGLIVGYLFGGTDAAAMQKDIAVLVESYLKNGKVVEQGIV